MRKHKTLFLALVLPMVSFMNLFSQSSIQEVALKDVAVRDTFWSPKINLWRTTTLTDVLNKFSKQPNAFLNFDLVARGLRDFGTNQGFPWFDGLVYETIRGASDFLEQYPDSLLEVRLDRYIDRIAAAQASDPDGYLDTYTQLIENNHRWGMGGGLLLWQHDVYNAGMLFEAGVHYYKATGKTKLLTVAVRLANYMYSYMGPAPKKNIVPAHSGPEEALLKLYTLFRDEPQLKTKISLPVDENQYYALAKFWIESRGDHCGYPLWSVWGGSVSEQWIRDAKYDLPQFGNHSRPSFGSYAQDSVNLFKQKTIEGHAVRATLYATGVTMAALLNHDQRYIDAATRLWDNMAGKRMFVTGGVGAIAEQEKFGPDYYLPTGAYLETCAAVGAGFFSQRMNQLTGNGKYMDEFERSLYNGSLTCVSSEGTKYTYQNPLNADTHSRWEWHDCPCCPPMFLKMMSAFPGYIYSYAIKDTSGVKLPVSEIYVNLFVGSEAKIHLDNAQDVTLKQTTNYPWGGNVQLTVSPNTAEAEFALKVRIPGWATGTENFDNLYSAAIDQAVSLKVNGEVVPVLPVKGYVSINRKWSKADRVELILPMEPRFVYANNSATHLRNKLVLASGPVVYCLEQNMNPKVSTVKINTANSASLSFRKNLLGGINVISGSGLDAYSAPFTYTAIPYYALGNIKAGDAFRVWLPYKNVVSSLEETQTKSLEIYPNPVSDILQVKSSVGVKQTRILNLNGTSLMTSGPNVSSIDVTGLLKGLYLIEIRDTNDKVQILKFEKK